MTYSHPTQHRIIAVLLGLALFFPFFAGAQEGLSLTVAPPLFQFTLMPGETWASSIKVSNGNSYDITVYATPVNFESVGDGGKGRFVPLGVEDTMESPHSLAGWIDITRDPIVVARGESVRVPFFVNTPEGAEPGGHYASILIGTRPVENGGGSQVKVSSLISTLLFARVSGDIVEEGHIREFSTEKSLYETPEAMFNLRFENTGNVHLLPQGSIVIYNMWGKERGRIDVNKDASFGNVFPGTDRNYPFTWQGENNFYDIGRYKAITTLSYGAGERQSDFQEISFWVIPIKPLLWIVSILGIFLVFIVLSIRRYVRHALKMQTELLLGEDVSPRPSQKNVTHQRLQSSVVASTPQKTMSTIQALKQPVVRGAVDLRRAGVPIVQGSKIKKGDVLSKREFIKKYQKFLIFLSVFIIFAILSGIYFREVLVKERDFKIEIQEISAEKQ